MLMDSIIQPALCLVLEGLIPIFQNIRFKSDMQTCRKIFSPFISVLPLGKDVNVSLSSYLQLFFSQKQGFHMFCSEIYRFS